MYCSLTGAVGVDWCRLLAEYLLRRSSSAPMANDNDDACLRAVRAHSCDEVRKLCTLGVAGTQLVPLYDVYVAFTAALLTVEFV
ncbi:hypothetical protein NFJ02_20g41710 [Pycnococcus provasolii]